MKDDYTGQNVEEKEGTSTQGLKRRYKTVNKGNSYNLKVVRRKAFKKQAQKACGKTTRRGE